MPDAPLVVVAVGIRAIIGTYRRPKIDAAIEPPVVIAKVFVTGVMSVPTIPMFGRQRRSGTDESQPRQCGGYRESKSLEHDRLSFSPFIG
jgi:hypothetical protein